MLYSQQDKCNAEVYFYMSSKKNKKVFEDNGKTFIFAVLLGD